LVRFDRMHAVEVFKQQRGQVAVARAPIHCVRAARPGSKHIVQERPLALPPVEASEQRRERGGVLGAVERVAMHQACCAAIQRSILASSTSSGTEPSFNTSAWKARMSKSSPSAASARSRSSWILSSPILYASAWP